MTDRIDTDAVRKMYIGCTDDDRARYYAAVRELCDALDAALADVKRMESQHWVDVDAHAKVRDDVEKYHNKYNEEAELAGGLMHEMSILRRLGKAVTGIYEWTENAAFDSEYGHHRASHWSDETDAVEEWHKTDAGAQAKREILEEVEAERRKYEEKSNV